MIIDGSQGPLLCATLLAVAGLLRASTAAPSEGPRFLQDESAEVAPETAAGDERGSELTRFFTLIAGLDPYELSAAVAERSRTDPVTAIDAVILRAGRRAPAGLSASRASERDLRRREALDLLRHELGREGAPGRLWSTRLQAVLDQPEGDPVLWAAAAEVCGELEDFERAGSVAAGLRAGRQPHERAAARRALHRLYVRWFDTQEEFGRSDSGGRPDRSMLETLRALDATACERLERILELDPHAGFEVLGDPDPSLRAAAARILGAAAVEGSVAADTVISRLLEHIEGEYEPQAFDAALGALLELLSSAPVDSKPVRALRIVLSAKVNEGLSDLQFSVAHALGSMPWDRRETVGTDSILRGIEWLAVSIDDIAAEDSAPDSDVLVGTLLAFRSLGQRAEDEGLDVSVSAKGARDALLALLSDEDGFEDVRVAAAGAVALIARPEDVPILVGVLSQPAAATPLRYNLIGSLSRLAQGLDPEESAAQELLNALIVAVNETDADLRRRALDVLGESELETLVGRVEASLYLERLEREPLPELQRRLLGLIGRYGDSELAAQLLESGTFDALAGGDDVLLQALAESLAPLVAGEPQAVMRAARRLIGVADAASEVARLKAGLGLLAAMPEKDARRLLGEEHYEVLGWALRLRARAGRLGLQAEGGGLFARRITELHIPGCIGPDDMERKALAHASALFLGDLVTGGNGTNGAPPDESDVTQSTRARRTYEQALAFAVRNPELSNVAEVRRDRARFFAAADDEVAALQDYRVLLKSERTAGAVEAGSPDEAGSVAAVSVLELFDLRKIAELIFASVPSEQLRGSEAAREAFDLNLSLVQRGTWFAEPEERRAEDLRLLIERAMAADDLERFAAVEVSLRGLPPPAGGGDETTNGSNGDAPGPADGSAQIAPSEGGAERPLWQGLLEDRARHAELIELRRNLRARYKDAVRPPEAPVSDPEDPAAGGSGLPGGEG